MQTLSKYTKLKVIAGYTVLFIASTAAIVFIYKQITQLAPENTVISSPTQKLLITGNTITGLYEAEALNNAFMQTGSEDTFKKYLRVMEQVADNIDSLSHLTTQEEQLSRIDSIDRLLKEKTQNLQELIRAKKSLVPEDFYNKVLTNIELTRDSTQEQMNIRKRVVTTLDSTFVKPEKKKKGFWGSIFGSKPDSTLKITVSHHTIVDSINSEATGHSTDSVVNILKATWEDIQQQTQDFNRKINRREFRIISQSAHITEQLRRILSEYEQEEISNSLHRIVQREQIVNRTTGVIAWIVVAALILIIFFCSFILRDLSRSQRYRKELEAAKRYTDQLLESREKLMLTVTHDIKSPLGSVMGYIELLHNTRIDERQRYFLKNMKGSSEHILNLVTNLLDFSKLESNQMTVEEVVYNPMRLFTEIKDSFIPSAQNKKLELSCKIGQDLDCNCKGDALRIRQILVNLISNAIKYTAKGSVSLTATTSTTNQQIILKIKDTGYGMSKEEQEVIFKEFTRLSSATQIEGTGLGLTITLKLVQLLGGDISLESIPDKGSCFTVRLPLKPITEKIAADSNKQPDRPSPAISAPGKARLKILLVDDDPLQLEMTSGLLQNNGFQTVCTTQPESVADKLRSESYDLIFSDIQMPGVDGFELVRQIRNLPLPFAGTIPVIALSANAEKKEKDYLEAGFTAYLSKPFTGERLLLLVSKLTGQDIAAQASALSPLQTVTKETDGYTLKNILLFADGDESAVNRILESFIAETRRHLELMESHLSGRQWTETARIAHKMLPVFRQLETKSIIEILEQLEHFEYQPFSEDEIARNIEKVIREIRELIQKLPSRVS